MPYYTFSEAYTHSHIKREREKKTPKLRITYKHTRNGIIDEFKYEYRFFYKTKYLKLLLLLSLTEVFFLCFFVSITLVYLCICVSCIVFFFSFIRSLFVVSCLYPFLVVFTLRYKHVSYITGFFFGAAWFGVSIWI